MAGKMRDSSVHTFQYFFDSKCYLIELKFFEHLPQMKLKGGQKKLEFFSVILFPAMGIFPIGTKLGQQKPREFRPLLRPLATIFLF